MWYICHRNKYSQKNVFCKQLWLYDNIIIMEKNNDKEETKKSLYEYLYDNMYGEYVILKNLYKEEEIEHLYKMGFLSRGEDANRKERYKLTALGKKQIRMRCTRERVSKSLDTILSILE